MAIDLNEVSGLACMKTIERLDSIGIRFAGTREEKRSADWIEKQFAKLGLKNVQQQEFPCLTFDYSRCLLTVLEDGRWYPVEVEAAAHTPSTPKGGIDGPLEVVEKIPARKADCRAMMKGKILLLTTTELFDPAAFKRVMSSGPKGILVVDDRFPNDWTVAVGFPRYWVDMITCPVLNVSYMDAWEIVRQQIQRVHIEVEATVSEAVSQNVIAEIRGSGRSEEVIVVSGHHDSVINNPGPDDNLTGVAVALELARVFSRKRPKRTLRFISYGAEEQLSEGAKYYALNASDLKQIQLVLNVDAVGAWMGQTKIFLSGPPALEKVVEKVSEEQGYPGQILKEICPFSDHFPLNYFGVPIVWYYRMTYTAARHFHHSALETPDVVSPNVLERTARHQAGILDLVANSEKLPYPRKVPDSQMKQLKKMGKEWAGLGVG
ncbi:MAG: M28 family metallopeptidase [bacterium]